MKEKRKLRDKMSLNMVIPGDQIEQTTDVATFDLEKIKHKHVRSYMKCRHLSVHLICILFLSIFFFYMFYINFTKCHTHYFISNIAFILITIFS